MSISATRLRLETAWDRRLARRAAALGAAAAALAGLVVATTDQGGPWSQRLGMTAALAPLCGALGALGAARIAAARGELLALSAIGAEGGRAVRGAALGGSVVGACGPALCAFGVADLAALFPRAAAARVWAATEGGLREATLGLRVDAGGGLSLETPARALRAGLPAEVLLYTVIALGIAAVACPTWLVTPRQGWRAARPLAGSAAVGMAILGFQTVAAGRAPAVVLLVAPLLLLTEHAVARYRSRAR